MSAGSLVLIGPMGAGKSSVGRKVARRLGRPFVDTDAAVVRAHGPIDEIFRAHGEEHFRALERQAVREGLEAGGVVSLGGGAVLHPDTQADLSAHRVALLLVSEATVASRLRGGNRPLVSGEDPVARWREVYAARRELYERLADARFDTSTGPLQDVVDAICRWAEEESP